MSRHAALADFGRGGSPDDPPAGPPADPSGSPGRGPDDEPRGLNASYYRDAAAALGLPLPGESSAVVPHGRLPRPDPAPPPRPGPQSRSVYPGLGLDAVHDSLSLTPAGLGAVVAHKASDAVSRHPHARPRAVSTVLGANAIAAMVEAERHRRRPLAWDRRDRGPGPTGPADLHRRNPLRGRLDYHDHGHDYVPLYDCNRRPIRSRPTRYDDHGYRYR